jgi:undecaprenyl-diphosphatase
VTDPVTEGLEPEARADLQPAEPETTMQHDRTRKYGRIAAGVVVCWVLIVGALTGIGKLIMITRNANGNLLGDHTIPHWFAAHRTPALNHWSRCLRRVPRRHPSLAAGGLPRRGHVRRTGRFPDDRGDGQAPAT